MSDDATGRLELLRGLTAATPRWAVVKGADAARSGSGDIDSAAPEPEHAQLAKTFSDWATMNGHLPLAACRHVPGMLILTALEGGGSLRLIQLDLLDYRLKHGVVALRADDLLASTETDDGFRRLTPAAEAVARLVLEEWRLRAPSERDAAALRTLLAADPAGLEIVQSRIDARLRQALRELAAGTWPRAALLRLELYGAGRAMLDVRATAHRIAGSRARRACPLLRALAADRTAPADSSFAEAVARAHPMPAL